MQLTPPPPGFTWQEIPELKAAFLKPNGWFFKKEVQNGTFAYFITKENIDTNGEFQTGLTVNVFQFKKDSAVNHGKALIDSMASQHHVETFSRAFGPFKEVGCEFNDTDASGTTRMYTLLQLQIQKPIHFTFLSLRVPLQVGMPHGRAIRKLGAK